MAVESLCGSQIVEMHCCLFNKSKTNCSCQGLDGLFKMGKTPSFCFAIISTKIVFEGPAGGCKKIYLWLIDGMFLTKAYSCRKNDAAAWTDVSDNGVVFYLLRQS